MHAQAQSRSPWNKDKLIGQKSPLKLKEIWAIRIRLQLAGKVRDLALFNLAIDSKLRGCDLVQLRVCDVAQAGRASSRAIVMQRKTKRPVQFELTEQTRNAVNAWVAKARLRQDQFLFPSRFRESPHLSTRQYAKIVESWVRSIGLDPNGYGTHTMRRTKATLIYRRTKNLRAVQLLLGHTKLESTVRYLGIEVDDALEIAEQTEFDRARVGALSRLPAKGSRSKWSACWAVLHRCSSAIAQVVNDGERAARHDLSRARSAIDWPGKRRPLRGVETQSSSARSAARPDLSSWRRG
jgi:Phage integrase family